MTEKSLRVKLVIVGLLEQNLNQRISLLMFVLFTLHTKLPLTKFWFVCI